MEGETHFAHKNLVPGCPHDVVHPESGNCNSAFCIAWLPDGQPRPENGPIACLWLSLPKHSETMITPRAGLFRELNVRLVPRPP